MATRISDSFTEGSNTVLASHDPDIGDASSWLVSLNDTTQDLQVLASDDSLRVITGASGNTQATYYNSTSVGNTEYTVGADIDFAGGTGVFEAVGLVARLTSPGASHNCYAIRVTGAATLNFRLFKVVAGVRTQLGTNQTVTITGSGTYDNVKLVVRDSGNTVEAYWNDVSTIASTDTALTAEGSPGVFWGDTTLTSDDPVNAAIRMDNFLVTAEVAIFVQPPEAESIVFDDSTINESVLMGVAIVPTASPGSPGSPASGGSPFIGGPFISL